MERCGGMTISGVLFDGAWGVNRSCYLFGRGVCYLAAARRTTQARAYPSHAIARVLVVHRFPTIHALITGSITGKICL